MRIRTTPSGRGVDPRTRPTTPIHRVDCSRAGTDARAIPHTPSRVAKRIVPISPNGRIRAVGFGEERERDVGGKYIGRDTDQDAHAPDFPQRPSAPRHSSDSGSRHRLHARSPHHSADVASALLMKIGRAVPDRLAFPTKAPCYTISSSIRGRFWALPRMRRRIRFVMRSSKNPRSTTPTGGATNGRSAWWCAPMRCSSRPRTASTAGTSTST